jgi:signal transduction histidine kinase
LTRRLYLQLYLAFLGISLLCLFAAGAAFRLVRDPPGRVGGPYRRAMAELMERSLPGPDQPAAELKRRIDELAAAMDLDLVVRDPAGDVIATTTEDVDVVAPPPAAPLMGRRRGHGWRVRLPDGRMVQLRPRGVDRPEDTDRGETMFALLAVVAGTMALGCFPIARRITRRIEQLDHGVKRLGEGDFKHRVQVSGRDEIATLAASFNRAAEHIDALLAQQRQILANASHELRSPLTRLRLAIELAGEATDPAERSKRLEGARADIADLDALIEHVLVMARADLRAPHAPFRSLDLGALLAEEAERTGASVALGEGGLTIAGDPALLRYLVRNLLENARLHGGAAEVRARIEADPEQIRLTVEDAGPGVPEAERERIFTPFFRGSQTRARGTAGTGLGLAIVRQVARFHGGDVHYQPIAQGGSCFQVTLPRGRAVPASAAV